MRPLSPFGRRIGAGPDPIAVIGAQHEKGRPADAPACTNPYWMLSRMPSSLMSSRYSLMSFFLM